MRRWRRNVRVANVAARSAAYRMSKALRRTAVVEIASVGDELRRRCSNASRRRALTGSKLLAFQTVGGTSVRRRLNADVLTNVEVPVREPTSGRRCACGSTESSCYAISTRRELLLPRCTDRWHECLGGLHAAATSCEATTAANLRTGIQGDVLIPVPPPDEQAAIARILDAVDTALERTRAAVERARELDHSLLHELLTGPRARRRSDGHRSLVDHWQMRRVDDVARRRFRA